MSDPMNITTWIGVAASAVSGVVTVVTVYIRARTKQKLAAIDKGTPDEAARVVADAVTSFQLDAANLTKEQRFTLAREEIANRDKRHARVFYVALALALVLAGTTTALALGNKAIVSGDGNIVIQGSPSAHAGKP